MSRVSDRDAAGLVYLIAMRRVWCVYSAAAGLVCLIEMRRVACSDRRCGGSRVSDRDAAGLVYLIEMRAGLVY